MYRIRRDKLICAMGDDEPVGVAVDSFATALGSDRESETVILRLYHAGWPSHGGIVPRDQVHQFGLNARRAAALGQALLELAAQVEKESGQSEH